MFLTGFVSGYQVNLVKIHTLNESLGLIRGQIGQLATIKRKKCTFKKLRMHDKSENIRTRGDLDANEEENIRCGCDVGCGRTRAVVRN